MDDLPVDVVLVDVVPVDVVPVDVVPVDVVPVDVVPVDVVPVDVVPVDVVPVDVVPVDVVPVDVVPVDVVLVDVFLMGVFFWCCSFILADKAHRLSSLTKEERKIAVAKCYAKSLEIKELETVSLSKLLYQITSENQDSTERLKQFIKALLGWGGGGGFGWLLQIATIFL